MRTEVTPDWKICNFVLRGNMLPQMSCSLVCAAAAAAARAIMRLDLGPRDLTTPVFALMCRLYGVPSTKCEGGRDVVEGKPFCLF